MDFCSRAQIVARVPAIDAAEDPSVYDTAIAEAIAFGTDEICLYLGNKYPKLLDLSTATSGTVPRWLTMIAADLAASFVLTTNFSGGGEDKEPKLAAVLESRARSKMRALIDGTINLPGADDPDELAADAVALHTSPGQRHELRRLEFALDYLDQPLEHYAGPHGPQFFDCFGFPHRWSGGCDGGI